MSIWGKLGGAAAGLAVGGPLGALLGAVAGHFWFDRTRPPDAARAQLVFTVGVVALGAKMAKADGVVTRDEVAAFRQVFEVAPDEADKLARVFDLAKRTTHGYQAYARQLADLLGDDRAILEDLIDGLFHIAKADGAVHERELDYLADVAAIFGFTEAEFAAIRDRHVLPDREDPYRILGLARSAGDAEIRAAWHHLAAENHPDRHIARGLPEEFVRIATEKLARINDAYDRIARERGL